MNKFKNSLSPCPRLTLEKSKAKWVNCDGVKVYFAFNSKIRIEDLLAHQGKQVQRCARHIRKSI